MKTTRLANAQKRAISALADAMRELGVIEDKIRAFEELEPMIRTPIGGGPEFFIFTRDQLLFAGLDVSKWTKTSSKGSVASTKAPKSQTPSQCGAESQPSVPQWDETPGSRPDPSQSTPTSS